LHVGEYDKANTNIGFTEECTKMIQISETTIISIDKSDDSWAIEGEISFEGYLSTAFSATYYPVYDELEELEIEIVPGKYDKCLLKEMILEAVNEFD
jgi:hypothetical protein